ncbi:hypothetical protein PC118_g8682 [Phytophthora cactorum]|uniref:Uncharacterized protein n=1 Tax=Phytophthora cactorum TaxID=29920 RepID=A0A8T1G7U6_9STRA|nr:hypothetical protein PC118_g8682 [Phytophthora cactorum]
MTQSGFGLGTWWMLIGSSYIVIGSLDALELIKSVASRVSEMFGDDALNSQPDPHQSSVNVGGSCYRGITSANKCLEFFKSL